MLIAAAQSAHYVTHYLNLNMYITYIYTCIHRIHAVHTHTRCSYIAYIKHIHTLPIYNTQIHTTTYIHLLYYIPYTCILHTLHT